MLAWSIKGIEDLMMNQTQKVMLFSPCKAEAGIRALMLRSHKVLNSIDEVAYYDDNGPDSPFPAEVRRMGIAASWVPSVGGESDYADHSWTGDRVSRIADIRNAAIKHFLQSDCTHLFIVDADVICHPDQVTTLLATAHPIVSAVYWTKFKGMETVLMPNCWDVHGYHFTAADSILRLADPGTYEVGGLGACTLIHRSVLEAGVNYSPIKGWAESGEDRWFCMRAVANGFRLWVDTNLIPYHVYQEPQLYDAGYWYSHGADPEYFHRLWLDAAWRQQITNPPQAPFNQVAYEAQLAAEGKRPVLYLANPGDVFSGRWLAGWNALQAHCFTRFGVISPFSGYSSDVYLTRQTMWDEMRSVSTKIGPHGQSIRPTYILWLDDDNVLTADQIELMMATLDAHPSIGVVAAWTHIYRGDEDALPSTSIGLFDDNLCTHPLLESAMAAADSDLSEVHWTGFPAILMRGDCLDAAGDLPFLPMASDHYRYKKSGEDVSFCYNLRSRSPYQIVVDRRLYTPHLKLRADRPRNPALLALTEASTKPGLVQAVV